MQNTTLEFPCEFTIKVFGKSSEQFEIAVLSIINQHVTLSENALKSRDSAEGHYTALSITFTAESQLQLDQIYLNLTSHPLVLMAL